MYCRHCGNQIADGSAFCGACGKPVRSDAENTQSTRENQNTQNTQPTGAKKDIDAAVIERLTGAMDSLGGKISALLEEKTGKKVAPRASLIGAFIVISLLLALLGSCCSSCGNGCGSSGNGNGCGGGGKVRLENYAIAEFSGMDGYGTAVVRLDETGLYSDVYGNRKVEDVSDILAGDPSDFVDYSRLISAVTVSSDIPNNGHLSNGDTFEVTVNYNGAELGTRKRLKSGTLKVKVSGLGKPEKVDLFSDLCLQPEIEGVDGFGRIVRFRSDDASSLGEGINASWKNFYDFTYEPAEGLKNGDVVTVTATLGDNYDEYVTAIANNGYILPQKQEAKYEISTLMHTCSADEIPQEAIDIMLRDSGERFAEELEELSSSSMEKVTGSGLFCTYFEDKQDKNVPYYRLASNDPIYNFFNVVYRIEYYWGNQTEPSYRFETYCYPNVMFDEGGMLVDNFEDSCSSFSVGSKEIPTAEDFAKENVTTDDFAITVLDK